MEILSNRFIGTRRPVRSGRSNPCPPEANLTTEHRFVKGSGPRRAEWTILRSSPVNALLIGPVALTAAAVARIERSVRQPLAWWSPDQAVDVPELSTGTLVIRAVERLDMRQQQRLAQWIAANSPRVRVVALAREPLYARVLDGRFSAALYYRVNTVVVALRGAADLP